LQTYQQSTIELEFDYDSYNLTAPPNQRMPVWQHEMTMPGWNELCIGMDLSNSTISSLVNGRISPAASVSSLSIFTTQLFATSTVVLLTEVLSLFNFYRVSMSKVVPGSSGDLLAWNISQWRYDKLGRQTKIMKADIYSPKGGLHFLAVPAKLNFFQAVRDC
jgi:hypothetical protein